MVLCISFLAAAVFVWIFARKGLSGNYRKMLGIGMAAAVLGILAGMGDAAGLKEGLLLQRNGYGEGDYEQRLTLSVEGGEEMAYELTVPEQLLTTEQEQEYLNAAAEEIEREFPGENESVNHIERAVIVKDSYQEGSVSASWSFEDADVVDLHGKVTAEELPPEGVPLKARVTLVCGESERTEEFYFRVFPAERTEEEELFWQIGRELKRQGARTGETYLTLPQKIEGKTLEWQTQKSHMPEKIFLFGVALAAFVPLLEHSRKREKEKKRERLLTLEYPEIISKLALLLGAGMTLKAALRKLAEAYEQHKGKQGTGYRPAYEEILTACREIENGMGEAAAYERFGERCKNAEYRKLGTILAQNLKKGSYSLSLLLDQEAEAAFEKRKAAARRYGEEAGTKLLFPMMLMLGLVMIVLMVPAMLAFQM